MNLPLQSIEELDGVHEIISPFIHRTPVLTSSTINSLTGCQVYFKCENFQKIGAFKIRGALYAVSQLSALEREKGIATHSSGNHAQGIALAARQFNTKAFIAMPENSPMVKINAVRVYGAEITFCEQNQESREKTLNRVVEKTGATFIHPYDNNHIISGQATVAKELIEDCDHLDFIFAPVGGGGLMSGTLLTSNLLSPKTKVIGAEPFNARDAFLSVKNNNLTPINHPKSIADGLLATLSQRTFKIIQNNIHSIITVTETEITESMKIVWERMKIIIEPSAAVSVAALIKSKEIVKEKKVGIIISGGNVDLTQLPF